MSAVPYYVSVSRDSLSGELHSWRLSVHSFSVSASEFFEYTLKSGLHNNLSKLLCERLEIKLAGEFV